MGGHPRPSRTERPAPDAGARRPSGETKIGLHKNWHYLFVGSLLTALACSLALANAAFDFFNTSSYTPEGLSVSLLFAGYLGMFLTLWISPIPDYLLVPVYGYLCALGVFNPYATFIVSIAAAVLPIEFAAGKYAGRAVLLKALSYVHITEGDLQVADKWLLEHGKFSIFAATFIPFFYSVACLAAGTLKMRWVPFLVSSIIGFGARYVFLEYVGFYGVYIFTASFDYSQRGLFGLVLILSSAYAAVHIVRTQRYRRGAAPSR